LFQEVAEQLAAALLVLLALKGVAYLLHIPSELKVAGVSPMRIIR